MGAKTRILIASIALSVLSQQRTIAKTITPSGLSALAAFWWLLLGQLLVYQIWAIIVYPNFFSPLRHFPAPTDGNYLLGHTVQVIGRPTGELQCRWAQDIPNDGAIRYRMYFRDRLLLTNPKAVAEVLVQRSYDFVKPPQVRKGLIRILGEGILFAEGEEHKHQRKGLSPAFAYRQIKDLYPIFWAKSREMVQCLAATKPTQLEADAPGPGSIGVVPSLHPGCIEVGDFVSRATLDIVGQAAMGTDFNTLRDPETKLNVMYRTVFNPGRVGVALQIVGVLMPLWLIRLLPVQRNRDVTAASAYIKQLCRGLVADRRKVMFEKGATGNDIISVALASKVFTDEQLVNQCMTFLAAGHETTATAMTWAMLLLCRHPEIQQKLRDEVRSALPSIDSNVAPAEIDGCNYLQAVCLEVLRLRSPVSLTLRLSTRDTTIAGRFVPKGTMIVLVPSAVNTNVHLWGPDAGEFKPERWLGPDGRANSQGGADSAYSFLTFLHGPRSCIGQKFAMAEFACLLAGWVGRFDTKLEEGSPLAVGEPPIQGGITAKPKGGLWVTLTEIEGW